MQVVAVGDLQIKPDSKSVYFQESKLPLPDGLYEILLILAKAEGRIVPREDLHTLVNLPSTGTLSNRINRLRNFLRARGVMTVTISTVYKAGYCLERNE